MILSINLDGKTTYCVGAGYLNGLQVFFMLRETWALISVVGFVTKLRICYGNRTKTYP
jgi:hypothetical protein